MSEEPPQGASASVTPDPTLLQSQPAPRRLFKNRPIWGSASNKSATPKVDPKVKVGDQGEDPLGTFSRSRDTYRLLQEQEARVRREKERAAEEKEKKRLEKEKQKEAEEGAGREAEPARKKRRVSVEPEHSDPDPVFAVDDDNDLRSSITNLDRPTTPTQSQILSPRSTRSSEQQNPVVIDLPNDDELKKRAAYHHERITSIGSIGPPPPHLDKRIINLDDDDDASVPNLPRSNDHLPTSTQPNTSHSSTTLSPLPSQPTASAPPASQAQSPILSLLIHSCLPNTSPLLVKRRLNQRLKEVRIAWLTKQQNEGHLPANFDHSTVFLTWRGKPLYDFTTCKSLGVGVDEFTGEVVVKGGAASAREEREWEEQAAGNAQLVFEAVTDAILAEKKKEASKPSVLSPAPVISREMTFSNGLSNTQALPGEAFTPAKPKAVEGDEVLKAEEKIKIVLRAGKDFEEYKLVVRSRTTVQKILHAYRKKYKIPPEKQMSLMFEGEVLKDEEIVGNTEIVDGDCVDVRVK